MQEINDWIIRIACQRTFQLPAQHPNEIIKFERNIIVSMSIKFERRPLVAYTHAHAHDVIYIL